VNPDEVSDLDLVGVLCDSPFVESVVFNYLEEAVSARRHYLGAFSQDKSALAFRVKRVQIMGLLSVA
jgi:hypothetical protein